MNSETSFEQAAGAALPSPMESPPRPTPATHPQSGSPDSAVGDASNRAAAASMLLSKQQDAASLSAAASSLPTPSSSPPSLQHLQTQQAAAAGQQAPGSPGVISNADLLKYLAANGLNPADVETILRQRAYQEQQFVRQAQTAQAMGDMVDLDERLSRRLGELDLDGRGSLGGLGGLGSIGGGVGLQGQAADEQRWLRQQQQQRLQQEALLRGLQSGLGNGLAGSLNAPRRQDMLDSYEDLLVPGSGRVSPTSGGRGFGSALGSTALANSLENGISSNANSQATLDALREGSVAQDSYANGLGGAFLNNLYGPGGLNAYAAAAAAQQRKPFHQRELPNITPPEGYVCKLCFIEGHFLRHCPLYKERPRGEYDPYRKAYGDSIPPENYLCKLCFIPGHWMKNCALYKERNPVVNSLNANANAALAAYRNGLMSKANVEVALASARMAAAYGYRGPPGLGQRKAFSTVPPDGYVCKICAIPGHWIQQCPLRHTQPPPHYSQNLLTGDPNRMVERLLA